MRILACLLAALLAGTPAHAAPFTQGDPKAGKVLHDKTCIGCHAGMFGGDGSKIYTRPERKTRSAQQLAARISACNANTGAGWFPEEEAHVGAYLNLQYYKFK